MAPSDDLPPAVARHLDRYGHRSRRARTSSPSMEAGDAPPTVQGEIVEPPVMRPVGVRGASNLGITAVVLGGVVCMGAIVPPATCITVPLIGFGLLIGLVGLLVEKSNGTRRYRWPLAGVALCVLGFVLNAITFTLWVGEGDGWRYAPETKAAYDDLKASLIGSGQQHVNQGGGLRITP